MYDSEFGEDCRFMVREDSKLRRKGTKNQIKSYFPQLKTEYKFRVRIEPYVMYIQHRRRTNKNNSKKNRYED